MQMLSESHPEAVIADDGPLVTSTTANHRLGGKVKSVVVLVAEDLAANITTVVERIRWSGVN